MGDVPTAVAREVEVPGVGSADVVVVEADGEITLVQCKLAANAEISARGDWPDPRLPRGLLGLVLDDLASAFLTRGVNLAEEFHEDDDWDEEAFREAAGAASGRAPSAW